MVAHGPFIQNNAISSNFSATGPTPELEFEQRDDHGDQEDLVSLEKGPVNGRSQFIERLEGLVKRIPKSIPEGSQDDQLAPFGDDPQNQDVSTVEGDELWEVNLNSFLKGVLGWGTEDAMERIVRRGKKGMDGVLEFARYFIVERGVSEGLFEGKFSGLLDALERM
jgi:hypothetical protein